MHYANQISGKPMLQTFILEGSIETDQYTILEQSANCTNSLKVCIYYTFTTSVMDLHTGSYMINYNIAYYRISRNIDSDFNLAIW